MIDVNKELQKARDEAFSLRSNEERGMFLGIISKGSHEFYFYKTSEGIYQYESFSRGALMEDIRKRYKVICPVCNSEMYVCKSIAMSMGMSELGIGNCWNCKILLHLEFDPEAQEMKAVSWDEWVKNREEIKKR